MHERVKSAPGTQHRLLCLWLLAATLLCAGREVVALDRFQVEGYLLPNGLQLLLKPGDERAHVSIRLVVGVGFDDFSCTDQELPHLLEHLLFSGIDEHGEGGLEERMQALGGEWNAFTSSADTTFVIEAPAHNQRKVLDLLLAAVTRTTIDEKALASAKRIIEHEDGGHHSHLQRLLDKPARDSDASSQLAIELGLKCPQPAEVADLTLTQVRDVRQNWYAPNNMSLIVVGGLDKLLPAYLERTWGALDAVEPSDHQDLRSVTHAAEPQAELTRGWLGEDAKLHLYFVEPVLETAHPATLDLLQMYLEWELYRELRLAHGLSYGPWVARESYGDSGLLSLNADVDRADIGQTGLVMGQMIARLRDNGVDAETFKRLKNLAIARQAWAAQGNVALADYYWGALADYTDGRFASPARQLAQVTVEDANTALRQMVGTQGYIRVEKPLLSYDELYRIAWAVLIGMAALLVGLIVWRRAKRR
ncbi:M16 family metallopeptidase [Pseudomonas sp. CFBP 13710]|uniref:M16 family metallopeptidase n=1 Tax=Pseudomonas sp. CFBP 13710 TaxID=2775311 RepID=UPI00177EC565|nr:insulinase family protein [Pseudomonas sp. CFBP 13710]MBD8732907.1 insulinase family protein [Pseudomonas sp. CFBP 13710]